MTNEHSTIEFTTGDIAQKLNLPEAQIRIASKQMEIVAPYSASHLEAFKQHFERLNAENNSPAPLAQNSPAPAAVAASPEKNLITLLCDGLESELTTQLKTEMRTRLPAIKTAVIEGLLTEDPHH